MQTLCCFRPGRTLSNHDSSTGKIDGQPSEQQQSDSAVQQADAVPLDDDGHCTASITFTKSEKKGGKACDAGCSSNIQVKLVRPGT